jgi:hypothetical protein
VEGEYDFVKANSEFDKDKIADELGDLNLDAPAEQFYAPKTSFFDSISCDSSTTRTNRRSRQHEMNENTQTFGSESVDTFHAEHRGRGGFHRHRGGGRGGGRGGRAGGGYNHGGGGGGGGGGRGGGGYNQRNSSNSSGGNWRGGK